jgi:hypothetical protein
MIDDHLTLTDEQLQKLADLVAAKVVGMRPAGRPMLTVQDVSTTFRVSRAWVYENARSLGGVKLGPGRRSPLRFDPELVAAALKPVGGETTPRPAMKPITRRVRPKQLLPVHDG